MVKITSEAKQDLKEFNIDLREGLLDQIEKKLEKDRDRENISYISKPDFGIEFHRLKIISNGFNHRIYFEYIESEVTVFAVRHREYAYSQEDLEEVEERLEKIKDR